jgi:hypothetical protein
VLANDSDIDGDTLTITAVGTPDEGGTAVTNGSVITYTSTAEFTGTEAFTYTVADGKGGASSATVTMTVVNINDAPVAVADSFTVNEDATTSLTPLANDSDVDGDSLTIVAAGVPDQGGTAVPGSTTIAYTPGAQLCWHRGVHLHRCRWPRWPGDGQHYRDGQQR